MMMEYRAMSAVKRQVADLVIYELSAGDMARISAMQTIFARLMPQYRHYATRLQRDIDFPGNAQSDLRHHVWLIEIAGASAAMCAFEYVRSQNVGLGMDIAVYPEFRSLRYGDKPLARFILDEMVCQLALDAAEAGQTPAVPMGGEVDNGRLLARYIDYGFVTIPVPYYEPPDVSGTADILVYGDLPFDAEIHLEAMGYHRMTMGFFPPDHPDFKPVDPGLWRRLLEAFYIHHYHLSKQSLALKYGLETIRQCELLAPVLSVA
jgi:hypothetical protein